MPSDGASSAAAEEYAIHGLALACVAGGVAHEVRNPLNAMALQVALLAEKIGGHRDLAEACARSLANLQEQIGRVEEVVRRFAAAAHPEDESGLDVGRLVAESAVLFGHEARRRRGTIEARVDAPGLRVGGGARAGRLWMGLVWRSLEEAGEAGRLRLSAAPEGAEVVLAAEFSRREPNLTPPWMAGAAARAARALGGRLEETCAGGVARLALRLPAEAT